MPLSKIVVDANLSLSPYSIDCISILSGGYKLQALSTQPLDAVAELTTVVDNIGNGSWSPPNPIVILTNTTSALQKYVWRISCGYGTGSTVKFTTDGIDYEYFVSLVTGPIDTDVIEVLPGNNISVTVTKTISYTTYRHSPKYDFDLSTEWLSLNINMGNMTATLTIPEIGPIPYADYKLYFPLMPTSLQLTATSWYNLPLLTKYVVSD